MPTRRAFTLALLGTGAGLALGTPGWADGPALDTLAPGASAASTGDLAARIALSA